MTALDVLIVVWGAAAFLVGMLCSNAPEEVDGDHLGGTAAVENTNTQNERASA